MNNFTPRAQQVMNLARREADRFRHNYIGAEHVLLGLLKLGQGVAVSVMENNGINIAALAERIEKTLIPGNAPGTEGSLPYTPRVRKLLTMAGEEAKSLRHTYIGTEHILLAILRDSDGLAWHALSSAGLSYDSALKGVQQEISPKFSVDDEQTSHRQGDDGMPRRPRDEEEEDDEMFLNRQSAGGGGYERGRTPALKAF